MTEDVDRKVIGIIAEQAMLDPQEIRLDASPADLGLDSLALVEIVFAIEEAFDVSVSFNANEPERSDFDISTVGHIIAAVKQLVAEKS